VLQAPIFDSLSFYLFALLDDGLRSAEVGIGRCDVVQALVIALMVAILDERFDLLLKVAGQEIVLQQDAVVERLVPALDPTPCLRLPPRFNP
jgi:hypothetical protein